jgi:hypothetical protein
MYGDVGLSTSTGQLLFADLARESLRKPRKSWEWGPAQYDESWAGGLRSAITKFMDNLVQKLQSVEWSGPWPWSAEPTCTSMPGGKWD